MVIVWVIKGGTLGCIQHDRKLDIEEIDISRHPTGNVLVFFRIKCATVRFNHLRPFNVSVCFNSPISRFLITSNPYDRPFLGQDFDNLAGRSSSIDTSLHALSNSILSATFAGTCRHLPTPFRCFRTKYRAFALC
jgi:hypothetical protein